MSRIISIAALLAASATLCVVPIAGAQPVAPAVLATPPDPLDSKASVPALTYRSPFTGYRPNVEQTVGSWKEANDTAGQAGGWRVYARQAREPDATPAANPAPAPTPAPQRGHSAH